MRRLAFIIAGAVAAACTSFDLVDPGPSTPSVDMVISARHARSSLLSLKAVLRTAQTTNAESAIDTALYVNGALVAPQSSPVSGQFNYDWVESTDTAIVAYQNVRLAIPAMGLDSVDVEVPGRLDGYAHTAMPYEGVLLRLSPIATPDGFQEMSIRWQTSVGQSCTEMEQATPAVYYVGRFPIERWLTTEYLARFGQQYVNVCLRAEAFYRPSDAGVRATLTLVLVAEWNIHVIPAVLPGAH